MVVPQSESLASPSPWFKQERRPKKKKKTHSEKLTNLQVRMKGILKMYIHTLAGVYLMSGS